MKKHSKTTGKVWMWLIVAEAIICYMAVLTAVSYARGPNRYETVEQPLLVTDAFTSFAGQPTEPGGAFFMENETPGTAVGYQAQLNLAELGDVQISFQVECPEGYAGGTLFADLYNSVSGYDAPEQEFSMMLQAGHNAAVFVLDPGLEHPDVAYLRFFTLDRAGYSLENMRIHEQRTLPKIPGGIWIGVGVCFLLLVGTVVCRIIKER